MRIAIKVSPNAKENSVITQADGSLKVRLKAKPIEGRANQALLKVLAGHFNCASCRIIIKKGLKNRDKIVEIST